MRNKKLYPFLLIIPKWVGLGDRQSHKGGGEAGYLGDPLRDAALGREPHAVGVADPGPLLRRPRHSWNLSDERAKLIVKRGGREGDSPIGEGGGADENHSSNPIPASFVLQFLALDRALASRAYKPRSKYGPLHRHHRGEVCLRAPRRDCVRGLSPSAR